MRKLFFVFIMLVLFSAGCGMRKEMAKDYGRFTEDYEDVWGNYTGSGINPQGPPGVEGQTPSAYKEVDKLVGTWETDGETRDYSIVNDREKSLDEDTGDKKIYTGYQQLRVADVEETKSAVIELTEELGGYVEQLYMSNLILRIPKEHFTEAFNAIMEMGEVLNKTISTYDVSEYFQDLSLRLDIAEKARARLYVLLEKTNDVEERLKILKEISRLSEEIERISLSLEGLKQLISYSRITVDLVPRLSGEESSLRNSIPFRWIADLDAFYVTLPDLDGSVEIELPDEFAVFTKSGYFHAETPDGTVVRIGTAKNKPEGDNEFWQEALAYHLGPFYKTAEKTDLGSFNGVLFESKDRIPYYYLVAVMVDDKDIQVLEIMFPDTDAKDAMYDVLTGIIKEAE